MIPSGYRCRTAPLVATRSRTEGVKAFVHGHSVDVALDIVEDGDEDPGEKDDGANVDHLDYTA